MISIPFTMPATNQIDIALLITMRTMYPTRHKSQLGMLQQSMLKYKWHFRRRPLLDQSIVLGDHRNCVACYLELDITAVSNERAACDQNELDLPQSHATSRQEYSPL